MQKVREPEWLDGIEMEVRTEGLAGIGFRRARKRRSGNSSNIVSAI